MSNPYGNEEASPARQGPREVDLDAELRPTPDRASAVKLALYAGLVLLVAVPALVLPVAYLHGDGGFESGIFSVALVVLAVVSGVVGLLITGVAGFLLLVYGDRHTGETEVFGSAIPGPDRTPENAVSMEVLDLRYGWSPALAFLIVFALAQIARTLIILDDPDALLVVLETVGGIINVMALLLFFFFWSAGFVRLNQANVRIGGGFLVWPLIALAAFFGPVFWL